MANKYPNDIHFPMTDEEINEAIHTIHLLDKAGKTEEARRLGYSIPKSVNIAELMKLNVGLSFITSQKINLWPAIEKYGEAWIEEP